MNWSASILSTVSTDTEPSLMVTFDNAKYMFNAGENTIRSFCHTESNMKRLKALFLTQLGANRAGGLADASSINDLNITGPPGLTHYLATMRFYTYRDNLRVSPSEVLPQNSASQSLVSPPPFPIFKDENITVYALPLASEGLCLPPERAEPPSSSTELPLKRKRDASPDQPRKRSNTIEEPSADHDSNMDPPLSVLMARPGFKPENLSGSYAQEWRNILVQTMFPVTRPKDSGTNGKGKPSQAQGKTKGKGGKSAAQSGSGAKVGVTTNRQSEPSTPRALSALPEEKNSENVDEYRRSRPRIPRGYNEQLPPPFAATTSSEISQQSSSQLSRNPIAYVVVGPQVRGKFDVQRATALGVPNGPMRGQLTRGNTVTFEVKDKSTGESRTVTVRPEECMGESEAPSVVIMLDVPTPAHIPSLIEYFKPENGMLFSKLRSTKGEYRKEHTVKTLFHLCGERVLEDPRYKEFMQGFDAGVDHIIASREHCSNPITFTSAAFNQLRLNKLDAKMFPLQKFRMEPKTPLSGIPGLPPKVHPMISNLKMNIRPYSKPVKDPQAEGKDYFHPLIADKADGEKVSVELPEQTMQKFTAAQKKVAQIGETRDKESSGSGRPGDDVVIVPLGTGSAIPGKYRTVSSTLIQIPKWGNVLLDAGEGTYYQLERHFGEEAVKDVLRDLKCLYVSHLHGDHHMGVPMLLRKRLELDPLPQNPLYLVTIRSVHLYLREVQQLHDLGIRDLHAGSANPVAGNGVITVMSEALHYRSRGSYPNGYWNVGGNEPWVDAKRSLDSSEVLCRSLGLNKISTVDMHHGTRCYGLVLEHNDGWSIVFSGDTQPTERLVVAGKGATLLIHEATMADDEADLAKQKKHSTFGQAIDIGKRMQAQNILLTHFSARYPKVPMTQMDIVSSSGSPTSSANPVISLAFDQSSLRIGDMWKMQYYLPALEQNYKDTVAVEGEEEDAEGAMVDMDVGL